MVMNLLRYLLLLESLIRDANMAHVSFKVTADHAAFLRRRNEHGSSILMRPQRRLDKLHAMEEEMRHYM
jgi:hypothetical protein